MTKRIIKKFIAVALATLAITVVAAGGNAFAGHGGHFGGWHGGYGHGFGYGRYYGGHGYYGNCYYPYWWCRGY